MFSWTYWWGNCCYLLRQYIEKYYWPVCKENCCWDPYTPYCIFYAHLMCFAGVVMLPRFKKKMFCVLCFISTLKLEANLHQTQSEMQEKHRDLEILGKGFFFITNIFISYICSVLTLVCFRAKLRHHHHDVKWSEGGLFVACYTSLIYLFCIWSILCLLCFTCGFTPWGLSYIDFLQPH